MNHSASDTLASVFAFTIIMLGCLVAAVLIVRFVVRPFMHWIDRESLWRADEQVDARMRRNARLRREHTAAVRHMGTKEFP